MRPQPSPDGKQLAFVRRVRGDSVLSLFDLESGEALAPDVGCTHKYPVKLENGRVLLALKTITECA